MTDIISSSFDHLVTHYDALLADFDGSQVNSEPLHAIVGACLMTEGGVSITVDERYLMRGMGESNIWDDYCEKGTPLSYSKEEFARLQKQQFMALVQDIFDDRNQDNNRILRNGIIDLLSAFHRARKPVITVSNSPAAVVSFISGRTDLSRYVGWYFCSDWAVENNLRLKPAPDLYEGAIISTQPQGGERYLIIEDSLPGIRSALAVQRSELARNLGLGIDVWQIYYDDTGEKPCSLVRIFSPHTQPLSCVFQPEHREMICPVCQDVLSLNPV